MTHCALYHNPSDCTQGSETITDKLLTFAVAMREGKYGLGATVKVQSVKRACRAHGNNLYGYGGQVQIYGIEDTFIQRTYIQITYIAS
jgi:hypothetical protein